MIRRSTTRTDRHPLAIVARRSPGRTGQLLPAQPARSGGPARPVGPARAIAPAAPTEPAGPATPGTPGGQLARIGRTVGLLAVTSAVGWLLTSEPVSGPLAIPLTSIDDLRHWLDDATPAIVPAALLRLAALAVCAYLALALVLTLAAQLVDRGTGGRAIAAVRHLLPATLRGLLTGGAQCSLVAAAAFPAAALPATAVAADPPGPTATMTKLEADDAPGHAGTPAASAATATASMTRLPASAPPTADPSPTTTVVPIAPTTAPTPLAPVSVPPPASAPANPSTAAPAADDTWTVTPGDTFWSIAEEALTDQRGSFPPQHEIVRYWRQLIASNQSRLAAPGNPDLLLPGQSLLLPPPA